MNQTATKSRAPTADRASLDENGKCGMSKADLARLTDTVRRMRSGDLSARLPWRSGALGELAGELNGLAAQHERFHRDAARVAVKIVRHGRPDARLATPADAPLVAATAKAINDSMDALIAPGADIARVIGAVGAGDLSALVITPGGPTYRGEFRRRALIVDSMVAELSRLADELTRVTRQFGTEGRLGGQAKVPGVGGRWKELTDAVNYMVHNLTDQVRDIAQVTTAVANGDLTQKITADVRGEVLELKDTINTMVDQLRAFAAEVTRVAREVGTEGRLGGQAQVAGVSGTWRDLTESVNSMAGNLTTQVRDIAQVTTAVANGDLSQKISVQAEGEVAALADTINRMVDQLRSFAAEVTRVAREVGTEGILGGQADVPGVSGTWKDLTDSVNVMANNLTSQVRSIALVSKAIADGDLSRRITVEAKGEVAALADTINATTDTLRVFAEQVTQVARDVGTEGILGGQADVPDVAGTWKDLTDSVNSMANRLTDQVRNIAQVTTAVANGDLSQKITVDAKGEILELKRTINTMVDQLSSFASEVTRVAREVGTEGKLGGQAEVRGVSGTWKDLTDNVNLMAGNLTGQVRSIADVTTAVAMGDLSRKIRVDAKGEVAALADTINTMVDQLRSFAAEVTRVAREVGTEGKLGGQAAVPGVSGTWKDLTDNVNSMAHNLTSQVRNIAQAATAVAQGDLTQKITVDARGEILELKDTINTMVDQLSSFAAEVTRVAKEVGTEGRLGGQAEVPGVSGTWRGLTDNVNQLAGNLTSQVREIAGDTTAVANGDLSKKIAVEAKGEVAALADTINRMVDQLRSFAAEVTRVAKEVGTDGILGGQAEVRGVSGTWKDLTDNVNSMANNLTYQVRNIAQVATAVAQGDLTQKITVDVRGEILQLKDTINTMVDQLSSFAAEVTRVAKEVGTEGKLGGQAEVSGVSGTWKGLTDNVNQLAGNLTTQVRAIGEVTTAVASGDLGKAITVDAPGEVGDLKDTINQMIANLRDTTTKNAEQDWLKTNLARISGLMQGQRDLGAISRLIMSELTPTVDAQHGAFFLREDSALGEPELRLIASYGHTERKGLANHFKLGDGLVGQAALEKSSILFDAPGDYVKVKSGLGAHEAVNVIVLPVLFEEELLAVIELASLMPFSENSRTFLDQLMETFGVVLNSIIATMRTEELLVESQRLASELQSGQEELRRSNQELEQQAQSLKASEELLQAQQEELQQTNEELEEKATLLEQQKRDIEAKNQAIEGARLSLQEKAEQLAISSRYKSEFLANMSHELRTPLNSMLVLARLLAENSTGNLSDKQVEFATTMLDAGTDLLDLIDDVLDLSKVEAGKMDVAPGEVALAKVCEFAERTFEPLAAEKGLALSAVLVEDDGLPQTIVTDEQRLQQILRNLLSNAIKFTSEGTVSLRVGLAPQGIRYNNDALGLAGQVLAFAVTDTGIGIEDDKRMLIFEAFQQADGTTSRKYGGTGLGLSISREIGFLLGGEIRVESEVGVGSTFTLYLPVERPSAGWADAPAETAVPVPAAEPAAPPVPAPQVESNDLDDDRDAITAGDRVVLLVDGDEERARGGCEVVREKGFRVLGALRGDAGVSLAHQYRPDAMVVDVGLTVGNGIRALEHLKHHPDTRHIPVLALGADTRRTEAMAAGAVAFLAQPVGDDAFAEALDNLATFIERPVRGLLIVDDDEAERIALTELLGGEDVQVEAVGTGEDAL